MAHAKRIMRAYRKGWGDGFAKGLEQGTALTGISVKDFVEEEPGDVDF